MLFAPKIDTQSDELQATLFFEATPLPEPTTGLLLALAVTTGLCVRASARAKRHPEVSDRAPGRSRRCCALCLD